MGAAGSSKGAAKLASVLQSRMKRLGNRSITVSAELGVITSGKNLRLDSIPDCHLNKSDYNVCSSYETEMEEGDRVLVIWTDDGDPIVIDKIV